MPKFLLETSTSFMEWYPGLWCEYWSIYVCQILKNNIINCTHTETMNVSWHWRHLLQKEYAAMYFPVVFSYDVQLVYLFKKNTVTVLYKLSVLVFVSYWGCICVIKYKWKCVFRKSVFVPWKIVIIFMI